MPAKQIAFAFITFLHDLFTAIWVGGLITLGLTVLPAARKVLGMGPETRQLMQAIQRRLSRLVYAAIVVLAVTGMLLARRSPAFQGVLSFATPYATVLSLKHILVLLMIVLALVRSLALGGATAPSTPAQEKRKVALLLLNMVLGVLVLLLSGFSAALGAPPPL
jgi:uncharacterized membrane protein